jgi:hypothetical protein
VRFASLFACGAFVAATTFGVWFLRTPPALAADTGAKEPDKVAVDRARDQIKMLDDLYKTAVVGINDTYVEKQGDVPAAMVAGKVFDAMRKKGYHDARLIDVTGKPMNDENTPKTAFEKKAAKAIVDGKDWFEEVGEKDGKPVFRAATLVPAVSKTCAACHRKKVGDKLGGIVYELPIK